GLSRGRDAVPAPGGHAIRVAAVAVHEVSVVARLAGIDHVVAARRLRRADVAGGAERARDAALIVGRARGAPTSRRRRVAGVPRRASGQERVRLRPTAVVLQRAEERVARLVAGEVAAERATRCIPDHVVALRAQGSPAAVGCLAGAVDVSRDDRVSYVERAPGERYSAPVPGAAGVVVGRVVRDGGTVGLAGAESDQKPAAAGGRAVAGDGRVDEAQHAAARDAPATRETPVAAD